jgi:hypothetical protein
MSGLWIWLGAALLDAASRAWYDGWRGPLTPEEVDRFLEKRAGTPRRRRTTSIR